MSSDTEQLECIGDPSFCRGEVVYFYSNPRCRFHCDEREKVEVSIRELESDCVPDWFDPANAGERWEADY